MGNSQGKEAPEETRRSPMELDTESPFVKQILEGRKNLTGMERVKLIFAKDEFDSISPEIQRMIHTAMISMVVGGVIGAVGRGRIAHSDFIKSHTHEIFETPLEAKRKLQDKVTLGMGSGAFRIGWRLTLFTSIYMGVSTLVSTYRGKMGVLDQVLGAGAAGFFYKLPQGPKAQLAGTLIGSCLGFTAGVITLGVTKLTGETIDSANLRYYQIIAKKQQDEMVANKASKELLRKYDRPVVQGHQTDRHEFDSLAKFHDDLIAALEEERENEEETSKSTSTTTTTSNQAKEKPNNVLQQESSSSPSQSSSSNSATSTNVQSNKSNEEVVLASKTGSNSSTSNNNSQQIGSTASG